PGFDRCIIVEGEINALSLATVVDDWTIISPGATTQFCKKPYLREYEKYDKIVIVADRDKAGAIAVIELKPLLLKNTHDVRHVLIDKDFNDWLVQNGPEGLRE